MAILLLCGGCFQEGAEDEDDDACLLTPEPEEKPPPIMRHQWMRGSIDDSQVDTASVGAHTRSAGVFCPCLICSHGMRQAGWPYEKTSVSLPLLTENCCVCVCVFILCIDRANKPTDFMIRLESQCD